MTNSKSDKGKENFQEHKKNCSYCQSTNPDKLTELEVRIIQLEKDSVITITKEDIKSSFRKILKFCGWIGLVIIIIWVVYIFLYGLNARYGFGDSIIKTYHILYG